MAGPYREAGSTSLVCPRCGTPLPPGDLTVCDADCGVWAAASIAAELFERSELAPSRLTSWARKRVPCPHCAQQMTLYGHDMSLFQGCDKHGYWIDEDVVTQTGLGRRSVAPRLKQARIRIDAVKEAAERAEQEARARLEAAKRERDEQEAAKRREEAERAADRAVREAQRRDAERRAYEARVAAAQPYVDLVEKAVRSNQFLELAEHLCALERSVALLTERVASLEEAR